MASRTKRTEQPPTSPAELKAGPDGCEEASLLSKERYIPCNRPAEHIVGWKGRSETPVRMCAMCADHNVKNRGGYIVRAYAATRAGLPVSAVLTIGHNSQVTDLDLITENHKLEDQIKAGLAKFNEWAKPHKDRIKQIEDDIFARLVERGADSTKTDAGTAYISRLESVQITDQAALFDFMADHWDSYGDEIKLSIGIKAVRAYMDENNGQLPPGIDLSKYSRLNIKRS
jgi:hypothetical protein